MNWVPDFDTQWCTFMNIVQTGVRRECIKGDHCDPAVVEAIIESERSKWADSSHNNGAWLRRLLRDHRQVAESFERALRDVRVSALPPIRAGGSISFLVLAMATVALTALTFAGLSALSYALWQRVLGAASVGILVGFMLNDKLAQRRQRQIEVVIRELRTKLEHEGTQLRALVAQADVANRPGNAVQPTP